jgi:mono/diheme cytochrome c family protein
LYPHPPELERTANDWTVEQVYWLAKYGVKDTGMPAFGATQNEHELWAVAYVVKRLPSLKPDKYHELVSKGGGGTANK